MDLSIIIPAYNEDVFIEKCCYAVRNEMQKANLSYEIIVVDNGSTDSTALLVSKFESVKVFSIERGSVSSARNFGYQNSSGKILAFIDADVVITTCWVEQIIKQFQVLSSCRAVTGCQYSVRDDPSWIERNWFSCLKSGHVNGGNLIVSRSAFEILGGFNEILKTGEDVEFCSRAMATDGIFYEKNDGFVAIHLGYPRDLPCFLKREVWHGEGDFASLNYFLNSKVAIVSVFYFFSQLAVIIFFALGLFYYSLVVFILLLFLNSLISIYRFREAGLNGFLSKSLLNYFYFSARSWSLVQALRKRNKSY